MSGERIGSLLVWRESEALWRYLPLAPTPQRNEAGRANVTVMEAGEMVILTIGARLAADEAELATVSEILAKQVGHSVDLGPADVTKIGASLRVRTKDDTVIELATAQPSNLPPHTAAFSAMVQGMLVNEVREALPQGRLIVRYCVGLPRTLTATAELSGPWDGLGSVDHALARGDLNLHLDSDEGASDALIKAATEAVKARAATGPPSSVPTDCSSENQTETVVAVSKTEVVESSLTLEAALADWMH
jgi:hypothetical protein